MPPCDSSLETDPNTESAERGLINPIMLATFSYLSIYHNSGHSIHSVVPGFRLGDLIRPHIENLEVTTRARDRFYDLY